MASIGVHKIAGPIAYSEVTTYAAPSQPTLKWEFIGVNASGELRRWYLSFSTVTRKFTSTPKQVTPREKANEARLIALYNPTFTLRSDLPKGSIAVAMKAMPTDADIAEATMKSFVK